MSVSIPSHFDFGLDINLDVNGIPTNYSVAVSQLPKLKMGIDPIELKIDPLEIKPLDISFRLKEIPSLRVHFPVDYKVGLAVFGAELACLHLCGQAQVITEPYVPNPCECQLSADQIGIRERPPVPANPASAKIAR